MGLGDGWTWACRRFEVVYRRIGVFGHSWRIFRGFSFPLTPFFFLVSFGGRGYEGL